MNGNGSVEENTSTQRYNIDYKIYDTILEHIGHTPMVRLNHVPQDHGIECEVGW